MGFAAWPIDVLKSNTGQELAKARTKKENGPYVSAYAAAPALWGVTAYLNSAGYETRHRNYGRFIQPFRDGGVRRLLVHRAFGDARFDAVGGEHSLRIRGRDVL